VDGLARLEARQVMEIERLRDDAFADERRVPLRAPAWA